jgi:hypothetical protein
MNRSCARTYSNLSRTATVTLRCLPRCSRVIRHAAAGHKPLTLVGELRGVYAVGGPKCFLQKAKAICMCMSVLELVLKDARRRSILGSTLGSLALLVACVYWSCYRRKYARV